MLEFASASVRIANSERAVDECIETAFPDKGAENVNVVIVDAAMGHKLDRVAQALKKHMPGAMILGNSCGGVVGREGAGEAMTHIAMMMMTGPAQELAAASVDGITGKNSYEKGLALAQGLKEKMAAPKVIYLLCPGLGANCDMFLKAFDETFGSDVLIFGGTSADNYKALVTYEYIGDKVTENGAWAVGMDDPTIHAASKATHGFTPYGDPMVVTRADGNRIVEIDGMPAWAAYSGRLSLIPEGDARVSIMAAGSLAKELPPELVEEYGSTHILRGAAMDPQPGVMAMAVNVAEGDRFWLTMRDEALIFSEQEKALEYLRAQLNGHTPVAVFQADCLARGRTLFNKVMKDELIGMMQTALADASGDTPPWLGMYGFGEFCPLGGRNTFHTYTTSLLVLYR